MGYALGIDLGTTFTAAAVMRDGRAEVVPLGNHAATIPSMVFLREDDSVLIGDAAERRGIHEPARLAREFKRRFGDTAPIMLDRTPFSAERLLALMLRQIVADISERQGAAPDSVAVTHPANWGEYKIDLLRQAIQLAGLPEATFLSEPVAAALQYAAGERVEPGEVVAVYDLGGGTFDAAVLRKTADGFELLGRPQGIERLGGIDFDEAVITHVRRVIGEAIAGLDPSDPSARSALGRLRQECVLAKETLSADSDATIPVLLPNLQTQVRITRNEFEDMIRPILRETIDSLQRAIDSSGVAVSGLKAVLLAGGSSRIPLVGDMVRSEFARPVVSDSHPKHAVALGAARMAAGVAARPALVPGATPPPAPPAVAIAAAPGAAPPPAAPATMAPPAAGPPPTTLPSLPPAAAPRRPAWLWATALVVVAALAVIAVLVFTGGGDETAASTTTGSSSTQASPTTAAAVTSTSAGESSTSAAPTSTAVPLACSTTTGFCVGITGITIADGKYVVGYDVAEFDPIIGESADQFHVHFFYDSIPVEQAGAPGGGPWVLWDRAKGGGELQFDEFAIANQANDGGAGATEICVAVATHQHAIDPTTVDCMAIPAG